MSWIINQKVKKLRFCLTTFICIQCMFFWQESSRHRLWGYGECGHTPTPQKWEFKQVKTDKRVTPPQFKFSKIPRSVLPLPFNPPPLQKKSGYSPAGKALQSVNHNSLKKHTQTNKQTNKQKQKTNHSITKTDDFPTFYQQTWSEIHLYLYLSFNLLHHDFQ